MISRTLHLSCIALLAVASASAQDFKSAPKVGGEAAKHRQALRPLADLSYLQCHQIFAAASSDGLVFRASPKPLLDKATAPEAIADGAGIRLYYVSGMAGKHGIWTARAELQGDGWRVATAEPVLINGAHNGDIVQPDVIRLPDGKLRLYTYQGFFVTRQPKQIPGMVERPHRILTALSDDGVNFRDEGPAIQLDAAEHPTVVQIANGRFLLATTQPKTQRVLIGTSSEGSRFVLNGTAIPGGAGDLIALADGTIRLYYEVPGGIASRLSRDSGTRWENEPELRLSNATPIVEPSIIRLFSGAWWMFYRQVRPDCAKP